MVWRGVIGEYRRYMPVKPTTRIVTLLEGGTPLIRARGLERLLPGISVYLKFDGLNPTGSFKDRGMTMAISKAAEKGARIVACASTGNTSASAAAFAARAGLECVVLIPDGKIALGKLAQAIVYGAKVVAVQGNFDDALEMVRKISDKHGLTIVNSVNPFRIEGQKSAAFEICDTLGRAPDYLSIPVGNAGNITAYWKTGGYPRSPDSSVSRPRERRPSLKTGCSLTPRPSQRLSESAIRPAGSLLSLLFKSRTAR